MANRTPIMTAAAAAALRVKPADVKTLEAGEKKAKGKNRGGK